jgi:hypothetical protein
MRKLILILAAAGALVAAGSAQMMMMGGGDSPTQYLSRTDVKTDLKLTDDQNTKILAAAQDMRETMQSSMRQAFQDAQANGGSSNPADMMETMRKTMKPIVEKYNASVNSTLTADQQKRLLQIYMQIEGDNSIANPQVQKLIGLTDDQLKKIAELQSKMADANKAIGKKVQDKDIDMQTAFADYQGNMAALKTELGKIPTEAQKTKFKEAEGPKFTLDPKEPLNQFGGRRPGGGGPRGGGGN